MHGKGAETHERIDELGCESQRFVEGPSRSLELIQVDEHPPALAERLASLASRELFRRVDGSEGRARVASFAMDRGQQSIARGAGLMLELGDQPLARPLSVAEGQLRLDSLQQRLVCSELRPRLRASQRSGPSRRLGLARAALECRHVGAECIGHPVRRRAIAEEQLAAAASASVRVRAGPRRAREGGAHRGGQRLGVAHAGSDLELGIEDSSSARPVGGTLEEHGTLAEGRCLIEQARTIGYDHIAGRESATRVQTLEQRKAGCVSGELAQPDDVGTPGFAWDGEHRQARGGQSSDLVEERARESTVPVARRRVEDHLRFRRQVQLGAGPRPGTGGVHDQLVESGDPARNELVRAAPVKRCELGSKGAGDEDQVRGRQLRGQEPPGRVDLVDDDRAAPRALVVDRYWPRHLDTEQTWKRTRRAAGRRPPVGVRTETRSSGQLQPHAASLQRDAQSSQRGEVRDLPRMKLDW